MLNPRKYGAPPYNIAVVHGGPGAAGEMAPVAHVVSEHYGVLEPLQTADSVDRQVDELKDILVANANIPAILIGYSWGAWLSLIAAARYPGLVSKLILVSSGGFEEKHGAETHEKRISRLNVSDREEFQSLPERIVGAGPDDKDRLLKRIGELVSKTDYYERLPDEGNDVKIDTGGGEIFEKVWTEAAGMRASGELLELAGMVECPVVAIHGDYDPHPADGVRIPLAMRVRDFRFILLEKCGHCPWREVHARDRFFNVLMDIIEEVRD